MRTLYLFMALASCAIPVAADEVFRWIDADGHLQFGDTPPPDAREIEPVDIDLDTRINTDPDQADRLERQKALAEELARDRRERERARAEARRLAQEYASACTQYRDRENLLADDGVRWIKRRNPDGSATYYSDVEIARMRVEAVRGVNYYCR